MKRTLLIVLLLSICSMLFANRIIYVNKNASGMPINGSSWNNAYRSIESALQNANYGDTLHVSAHSYTENKLTVKDHVSIIGGFIPGTSTPSGTTILNGQNTAGHAAFIFGDYSKIRNFQIRFAPTGIEADRVMAYEIHNCTFEHNIRGVYLKETYQRAYHLPFIPGQITTSTFNGNSYAIMGIDDHSHIKHNHFFGNSSYSIYVSEKSTTQISSNLFRDESVSLQSEFSAANIFNNIFTRINHAGIQLISFDESRVYNNVFSDSDIGIKLNQDKGTIYNNQFENNYYGVYGDNYATSYVGDNNVFINNDVGIFTSHTTLRIEGNEFTNSRINFEMVQSNNRIYGNLVTDTRLWVGRFTGRENSIYNNLILDSDQLFYFDAAAVNFFNNTVVRYSKGLHFRSVDAVKPAYIYNNIFWIPSHPDVENMILENSPSVVISNNMYQNVPPAEDLNPVQETLDSPFYDVAEGNYSLHKDSAAIDAGYDNIRVPFSVVKDMAGNRRWEFTRQENLPADTAVITEDINLLDLGAYEYQSPLYELTAFIDMQHSHDPAVLPINWEADSLISYDGLHHIELLEIKDKQSYFRTYFPTHVADYDPHLFMNLRHNTIDAGWYNILAFRIHSPIAKNNAVQFYFYDEDDTFYSTSFIDLKRGWNVVKINMAELSDNWSRKRMKRFRFDFAFTDMTRRQYGVPNEAFEFEFILDWVKLYPDRPRTSIDQSQWSLYY